jgi:hypothetical protein
LLFFITEKSWITIITFKIIFTPNILGLHLLFYWLYLNYCFSGWLLNFLFRLLRYLFGGRLFLIKFPKLLSSFLNF